MVGWTTWVQQRDPSFEKEIAKKLRWMMWPTPVFHHHGGGTAAVHKRLALSLLASIFFLYTKTTTTTIVALEASSFPRNSASLDHPHSTFADHSTTTGGSSIGSRGHEKASSSSSSSTNNNDHGGVISSHKNKKNKAVTSSAAHLERGVPLPASLEPEELYDVFRRLRRHYHEKAASHHHHHDWQVMYQYRNITISMLHHEHDPTCPYVKMEAYIPVPTTSCWDFLKVERWDDSMPKMDSFYEGTQVYGTYHVPSNNATVTLCRKRMTRLFAFGKRDMVFLSVEDRNGHDAGIGNDDDNNAKTSSPSSLGSSNDDNASGVPPNHDYHHRTLVSGSVSVVTDAIPRQKGYTRAYQDSISYYKPVPRHANDLRKTATHLTIYCRVDLNDNGEGGTGGSIPMWFYVRNIGKIAAVAIDRMRTALIQEEEREQREQQQQREQHVGNKSCPAVSTTTTSAAAAAAATTKGSP